MERTETQVGEVICMTKVLKQNPHVCPMCYTLDAYCKYDNDEHDFEEFPHGFVGRDKSSCLREARRAGWVFHKDGTATCPKCL